MSVNEKKNKILVLNSSVKCVLTAITTAEQVLNSALEGTYLNINSSVAHSCLSSLQENVF